MNRNQDERVTRAIAREVCQRENLKAFVAGSIARLGSQYVIALEACDERATCSLEQADADQKESVLAALGRVAARLRERLGESLTSIRSSDLPIERVTTSSLEAYRSYVRGADLQRRARNAGKRWLSSSTRSSSIRRLRRRTSRLRIPTGTWVSSAWGSKSCSAPSSSAYCSTAPAKRLAIEAGHADRITREIEVAVVALEQLRQLSPNESRPHTNLWPMHRFPASSRSRSRPRGNSCA